MMTLISRSLSKGDYFIHVISKGLLSDTKLCFASTLIICVGSTGHFHPVYGTILIFFRNLLMHNLGITEHYEAYDSYLGEAPLRFKFPKSFKNPKENEAMQKCVRAHQEAVNKQVNQWGVLKQVFHPGIPTHGESASGIALITQLSIEDGEMLFIIECTD